MVMKNSHVSQPALLDIGVQPGPAHLTDWLNANRGSSRYTSVLKLIRGIMRAEGLKKRLFEGIDQDGRAETELSNMVCDLWQELNKIFNKYKVFPHLGPIVDGEWAVWWMPVKAGVFTSWVRGESRERASREIAECNAVLTLLN